MVDHQKDKSIKSGNAVAYIYCESSEKRSLEPSFVLASLTKQLLQHTGRTGLVSNDLKRMIETFFRPGGPIPDLEDHEAMFAEASKAASDSVLIIDGVHEILGRDADELVLILRRTLKMCSKQKLFVSSRDHNNMFDVRKRLHVWHTQADIRRYIESEFERPITDNTQLLQQVKQQLAEKARGM